MTTKTLIQLFVLAFMFTQVEASNTIVPGEYITERAWGSMKVSNSASGSPSLKFEIYAFGANGHMCEIADEIQNNQAITDDKCVIQFEQHQDRVSVIVDDKYYDACKNYCGSRAWFPGEYFPIIPNCRKTKSIRNEFSSKYKSANYQQARNLLIQHLNECERFTDWQTQAEVRNDLAITEFHLGDKAACLNALEPIRIFVDDPAETGFALTPTDEEWGEAMKKTTRYNWKKCGGVLPVYSQRHGN